MEILNGIAINDYPQATDLGSCIADLVAIDAIIKQDYGFADITKLEGPQAKVANVEAELKKLFTGAAHGDQILFFYSGHGTQFNNGGNLEEALFLFDGMLVDNKLVDLAKSLPPGVLTIVLDSCFSGGMEKLPIFIDRFDNVSRAKWSVIDGTQKAVVADDLISGITSYRPFGCFPLPIKNKLTDSTLSKAVKAAVESGDEAGQPRLNGLLIAASSENKLASAAVGNLTMGLSAFTYCFRSALASNANSSVQFLVNRADQLLKAMGQGQSPIVKSNPASLVDNTFLSSTTASKGDGGKGIYPPPPCYSGTWASVSAKSGMGEQKIFGIDDAILIPALAGVITAAINANKKSVVEEKIFGIDDAILIPIVASVITTAINAANKSLDISVGVGISIKAPEIAKSVVDTMKSSGNEKIIGIDDAILIPAIASVITAAISAASKGIGISIGGGVVTPIGGGNIGVGVELKGVQPKGFDDLIPFIFTTIAPVITALKTANKGAQDKVFGIDDAILIPALVSVVTAAINANSKSAPPQEKVFGIDDAILIPALVSVVTAAINANSKSAPPQEKVFGIDDAILIPALVSVVTAAINANSKGQQKSILPLPFDPFSGNDLLDRIRREIGIKGAQEKVFGIDDAILIPALVSVVTAAINARK
jgi:hypothetical protein